MWKQTPPLAERNCQVFMAILNLIYLIILIDELFVIYFEEFPNKLFKINNSPSQHSTIKK